MTSKTLCQNPNALPAHDAALQGWVLFDGECGFCRTWVPFWLGTLQKVGFDIAPLQTAWVKEALQMTDDELLSDLRLVLKDGTLMAGADVYRFAMRKIWWARPFYFLSILPGLRQLFNAAYRRFAQNRYRISKMCGLK